MKNSKLFSILVSLVLVVGLCPASAYAAKGDLSAAVTSSLRVQAGNPYSGGYANCTWTAWQKAYDRLSVALPGWGNAGTWYSSAAGAGYSVGASARANSIAVWRAGGSNTTGHVAFVTQVSGSQMHILEGGYQGGYHEGWVPTSGTEYGSQWGGALIGFIYLKSADPTPPSGTVSMRTGVYHLTPKCAPKLHLDLANGSTKDGANLQVYTAHTGTAQSFGIAATGKGSYTIKPICSGLLLDISGNRTANGTNVQQWSNTGGTGQRWVFQDAGGGWYYIRSTSGMYLDVEGASSAAQTNVHAWAFNGTDAQKWKLTPTTVSVKAGAYALAPKNASTLRLDLANGSTKRGANVQLQKEFGGTAQTFDIAGTGKGNYTIKPRCSGLPLDIKDNSTVSGTNVWQWDDNGTTAQRWMFQEAGGGWYYIRSASGMYLDVENGGTTPQTNVWSCSYNGSNAQKWKLIPVSEKDVALSTITGVVGKTYTGKELAQKPVVKLGKTTLRSGTDYTLAYKNNKSVGMATVVVKGKGSYVGSRSVTFKINPKGASLKKLAAASGSFTATWTKQATQTSGYQVQYCARSDFKSGAKTVTVANPKATSKKVTGLASKAKYYVRVRTYKAVGKVNYYSGWSAAKAITTKAAIVSSGKLVAAGMQ